MGSFARFKPCWFSLCGSYAFHFPLPLNILPAFLRDPIPISRSLSILLFVLWGEDCIDVLIGCEDSWNLTRYSIHHDALSNWHAKPWSKRRIAPATRQKPPLDVQPLDGANGFFIPRVDLFFSDVFKLFRESLSMGDSVSRQFITSRFQSSPLNFPSSHELNEYQCDSSVCLAPLSFQAVLSRLSDASMNHDHVYFMQIGKPCTCQNQQTG